MGAGHRPASAGFGPLLGPGTWIRNASSLPVYQVRIDWELDGVLWRSATPGTVPPGDEPAFVALPRLSEHKVDEEGTVTPQSALAERLDAPNRALDVAITFRDTAGRTWHRSADGALVEVKARRRWLKAAEAGA